MRCAYACALKMRYSFKIILVANLFVFCCAENVIYQFYNSTTKSLAYYCENYRGRIPIEPLSSEIFLVESSEVLALKIGGCDPEIASYAIETCSNLRTLDLSHSDYVSLNSIPLKTTHLKKLNAARNWLMEIPWYYLKQTPQLIEIDFSRNELKCINSFDFEGATALKRIHLNLNRIHLISYSAFEKLSELEFVDLSGNAIQYGIEAFRNNHRLKVLNLAHNPLWSLTCDYFLPTASIQIDISFDYIRIISFQCEANPVKVVTNSGHEGILSTTAGQHEIHCNERCQFSDASVFHVEQLEIQNVTELMQHFSSELQILSVSDNFIGNLNSNTMQRFTNLQELTLIRTNLTHFDFGMLKDYDQLRSIDISNNQLKRLNHISLLDTFMTLTQFTAVDNQFEHVDEIIHCLPSSIESLDFSGNFVGTLAIGSFNRLKKLLVLNLSNTNLTIIDTDPFEELNDLMILDISDNDLSGTNDFSILSTTLSHISVFYATNCKIQNINNLIGQFGPSLTRLYLSNNQADDFNVNANTFKLFHDLQYLHLEQTNLIEFTADALRHQTKLIELNLSNNKIKSFDLRFISNKLTALYLQGNDLMEIKFFTKQRFPQLSALNISKNRLPCKQLSELILEWNGRFIDDPWDQKVKN